jgi:hypothetical protein
MGNFILRFVLAQCSVVSDTSEQMSLGRLNGFRVDDAGLVIDATAPLTMGPWPRARTATFESRVIELRGQSTIEVRFRPAYPAGQSLEAADSTVVSFDRMAFGFSFDAEPDAGRLMDVSGNGNTATFGADVSFVPQGVMGRAVRFNGGCLEVGSSPTLDPSEGLTVSAWIRPAPGPRVYGIFSRRVDYLVDSQFTLYLDARLWADLDTEDNRFEAQTVIPENQWTHVALVYDGRLPSTQRSRIYVDGRVDRIANESSASLTARSFPVRIGCMPATELGGVRVLQQAFLGDLDEAVMWTRALSEAAVRGLYARGASRHRFLWRNCDSVTCVDAGAFREIAGRSVSASGVRYLQYRIEAEAPDIALEWSRISSVEVRPECDAPDAGAATPSDAGSEWPDSGVSNGSVDDGGMKNAEDGRAILETEGRYHIGASCSTTAVFGLWGVAFFRWRRARRPSRRRPFP